MKQDVPRRRILKLMLGTGGAAAAFPDRWLTPVVETALLPAHAQTSDADTPAEPPHDAPLEPGPCIDDLTAVLTWADDVDLDLSLRLPGGALLRPGESSGPHSISADVTEPPGGETASIACGEALDTERYQLFVHNNSSASVAAFALAIDTPAQSATIDCTSLAPGTGVRVAFVDYSSGQGGVIEAAANPASCS